MTHYALTSHTGLYKVELEETISTNTYLSQHRDEYTQRMTLVTAEYQTAGRGATGSWHSQRGENLMFSLLVHPDTVEVSHVFVMSETICLAVANALDCFNEGFCIKWPNDIYYGDRKVVGILIENEFRGHIVSDCVMGVGVNVNQRDFPSNIPNPSSLALIVGHRVDRSRVLDEIVNQFDELYTQVLRGERERIHAAYLSRLYRKSKVAWYSDAAGRFQATLETVEPSGHLLLRDSEGRQRRYAFKEVRFENDNNNNT